MKVKQIEAKYFKNIFLLKKLLNERFKRINIIIESKLRHLGLRSIKLIKICKNVVWPLGLNSKTSFFIIISNLLICIFNIFIYLFFQQKISYSYGSVVLLHSRQFNSDDIFNFTKPVYTYESNFKLNL